MINKEAEKENEQFFRQTKFSSTSFHFPPI